MYRLSIAALLISVLASSSQAEEIESSMPVYDWSGFYVGAHIGYGDVDLDGTFDSAGSSPVTNYREHFDLDGLSGGIHGGYNWQRNNMLFGIEGGYSWSNARDSFVDGESDFQSLDLDGIATIRGRFGAIADRYMLYLTAGAAFTGGNLDVENGAGSLSFDEVGLTYGAGFEYAIRPGIKLRAEYLRMDFDQRFSGDTLDSLPDGDEGDVFVYSGVDTVRVGLDVSLNALTGQSARQDEGVSQPAEIADFSGLYVGLHGLAAFTDVVGIFDSSGSDPFARFARFDMDGFGGGAQLGYNFQHGAFVLGAEIDVSRTALSGSFVDGESDRQALEIDYFGTLRAKAGIVANNLLVYATAGIAYSEVDLTVENGADGLSMDSFGIAYGGGIEKQITPSLSVKAEFLRLDFNESIVATSATGSGPNSEIDNLSDGDDSDFLTLNGHDALKLGVNYRF